MDTGFLFLQTSPSHPGLVRMLTTTEEAPNPASQGGPAADPAIRFVARFNDLDAARLHAFSALRHHGAAMRRAHLRTLRLRACQGRGRSVSRRPPAQAIGYPRPGAGAPGQGVMPP